MPMSPYVAKIREVIGHDLLLMPGVNAIILNDLGEVLLQRRSDDGNWGLPGGAIDPGESVTDAVKREVKEETGLEIEVQRLSGIYSSPEHIHTYPNGDRVHAIVIMFVCRIIGGIISCADGESLELKFFPPSNLPAGLTERYRERIINALNGGEVVIK